jgi:peptidoglycan-N-acetylglucosamine deacetylase
MRNPSPAGKKRFQKMRPAGKLTYFPDNHMERQVARYRGICHIEGPRFERKLALTFDDGPSVLTDMLLDLLGELGVKATFFWLGQKIEEFEAVARRACAQGHTFGNHSFDHADFTTIGADEALREQIRKTQRIYRDTLGTEPSLVRPPFGRITDELIGVLKGMGMKVVFWSVDAGDWIEGNNTAERIANRVVRMLHEEAIILMHDGGSAGSNTIKAVRSIAASCKARGYEFVTVHDLIGAEESVSQKLPVHSGAELHTV